MVRIDRSGTPRGTTEPRWKRYGMHWHLFLRRHDLGDKARSAGLTAERYRSEAPDQVCYSPPEVLEWQRDRIREALEGATADWADGRRQGLDDLTGEWARRLRAQLDKGLSSFQSVRVSDTDIVDVAAYAISRKDCGRHSGR
jgi:hypothetical protein